MKKSLIGVAAVTLLVLSGCSSDETIGTAAEEFTPEELANVEIKLSAQSGGSASAQVTRAAIMGEDDVDIEGIGVFGLAREKQNINQEALDVSWFVESPNWSGCILDNVKSNKVGTDIEWEDTSLKYFYPITQFYSYDFYGYYPYLPSSELMYDDTSVRAPYVIDGTQDLLWGRATSDEQYAYSAKYFRLSGNHGKKPNIDLKHMLTRLVFSVVPGESYEGSGDYSIAATMSVKELQIVDAYTNLAVVIADLGGLDMAQADRITLSNGVTGTLTLCDVDAEGNPVELTPLHLSEPAAGEAPVPKPLGESIMLFPQAEYTIRILVEMDAYTDAETGEEVPAREFVSEVPLKLVSETTFEQGVSYNVKVTVHGPRNISLSSTLTPWEVQEGPAIEL